MAKFTLNPDKELVNTILEGLRKNKGYCPCKIVKDETTKCPCIEFKQTNHCHCGLFVKTK